jgi:hypothetical protein
MGEPAGPGWTAIDPGTAQLGASGRRRSRPPTAGRVAGPGAAAADVVDPASAADPADVGAADVGAESGSASMPTS